MASYTEHLELLKKDPVADGADTFNIQTMLNDNWEKIDAAVAGKADVGEDGKIPASQLPEMNYDPAGSAAAVQVNLAAHMADKNNPHGLDAGDVGARPNTWVPAWGDVTGKPGTFPPSGHTHDASQIVSGILSPARGGTGVGSIAELISLLQSNGIPRVYIGSYIGTGTYGPDNPTSITVPFAPKFVSILNFVGANILTSEDRLTCLTIAMDQLTTSPQRGKGFGTYLNVDSSYGYKSADGKTISWYIGPNNSFDHRQFNSDGEKYYFIAVA